MTRTEHLEYWMIGSAATVIFGLFAMGVLL